MLVTTALVKIAYILKSTNFYDSSIETSLKNRRLDISKQDT